MPLKRLQDFGEFAMLLALAAGLGYLLGLFSHAGTPEGLVRNAPLRNAGAEMFVAAALAAFACAWTLPRLFLAWAFGFGAGFIALVAHRVSIHAPGGVSTYMDALALSIAPLAGAMAGAVAGALGSRLIGRSAQAAKTERSPVQANRMMSIGKWIAMCAFLIPLAFIPFADPHDMSLPGLLATVLTPVFLFVGLLLYLTGRLRKRHDHEKEADGG